MRSDSTIAASRITEHEGEGRTERHLVGEQPRCQRAEDRAGVGGHLEHGDDPATPPVHDVADDRTGGCADERGHRPRSRSSPAGR